MWRVTIQGVRMEKNTWLQTETDKGISTIYKLVRTAGKFRQQIHETFPSAFGWKREVWINKMITGSSPSAPRLLSHPPKKKKTQTFPLLGIAVTARQGECSQTGSPLSVKVCQPSPHRLPSGLVARVTGQRGRAGGGWGGARRHGRQGGRGGGVLRLLQLPGSVQLLADAGL